MEIDTLFADAAKTMTNLRQASASVAELADGLKGDTTQLIVQANETLAATEKLAGTLENSAESVKTDVNVLVTDLSGTAKATLAMTRRISKTCSSRKRGSRRTAFSVACSSTSSSNSLAMSSRTSSGFFEPASPWTLRKARANASRSSSGIISDGITATPQPARHPLSAIPTQ